MREALRKLGALVVSLVAFYCVVFFDISRSARSQVGRPSRPLARLNNARERKVNINLNATNVRSRDFHPFEIDRAVLRQLDSGHPRYLFPEGFGYGPESIRLRPPALYGGDFKSGL
jgi:hypothetical protein